MPMWEPTSAKASSAKWPPSLLTRSRGVAWWRSTRRRRLWGLCLKRASTWRFRTWALVWRCCLSECTTRRARPQCRAWRPSRRPWQMLSGRWREHVWRTPSVRPPHASTARLRVNGWFPWVSASVLQATKPQGSHAKVSTARNTPSTQLRHVFVSIWVIVNETPPTTTLAKYEE